MKRTLIATVAFLTLIMASIQSASAIEIWKVDNALISQFRYASVADAKRIVGGYTMHVYLGSVPLKLLNVLPISSVAVLYFNPNGQVLGWSDKSDTVEAGTWEILRRYDQNDLCLYFPEGKGDGVCTVLKNGHAPLLESTSGNPFKLRAEQPVPYHLSRFGVSLKGIAKKLGI